MPDKLRPPSWRKSRKHMASTTADLARANVSTSGRGKVPVRGSG